MLTEDWISVGAVLVSFFGIIGMVWLDSIQEPQKTMIGEIKNAPEGKKLFFRAQITEWKPFQNFDRLELSDGNTVSVVAPKKLGLDWSQKGVFEFVGKKEPDKKQFVVLEAKKID
jgi:hypothetical protein